MVCGISCSLLTAHVLVCRCASEPDMQDTQRVNLDCKWANNMGHVTSHAHRINLLYFCFHLPWESEPTTQLAGVVTDAGHTRAVDVTL